MDKYIKEIKVFTFPELNGEAKEKAKEWYLNDETLSWELTDSYESDLSCIWKIFFPFLKMPLLTTGSMDILQRKKSVL